MFDTQRYLERRGSGLAAVAFRAYDGVQHTAASWIDKMAAAFNPVTPQWLLTILQAEQSLRDDKLTYPAGYRITRPSVGIFGGVSKPPAGARVVRSKTGDLYVEGEWKMVAATGAGIPDPGTRAPWAVEDYLGFDRQIYQAARLSAKFLQDFASGKRDVTLYPTRAEVEQAAREGRKPQGEIVMAADGETYLMLQYTPTESVAASRPRVHAAGRYDELVA